MIRTIGIDLGKTTFHVIGTDEQGRIALRKRVSMTQLLHFTANLVPCLIGMEACCGSHHLARKLCTQGHDVRLILAQFVRPFVKSNKNDFIAAEAITEAVQRPNMRFVAIKTEDQLDLQALHRVRDRLVSRRTGVINQLRAFLLERGITSPCGRRSLHRNMPTILADVELLFASRMSRLIMKLWQEWQELNEQIEQISKEIEGIAVQDAACQRLIEVPGVGPLVATALVAAVGNGSAFARARDLSAWLGLVPKQQSTSGKPKLLGISKRGNPYLRKLFIHGARSLVLHLKRDRHALGCWLSQLEPRTHRNVATIALANKLARICWAILARGESYQAHPALT